MIITIDGPSASGKSTVARLLAQKLGYYYLYSGLIYRALSYILLHTYHYSLEQLATPNSSDIDEIMNEGRLIYTYTVTQKEHISFDGIDITLPCKEPIIDQASSLISGDKCVRNAINSMQYQIAHNHNVIIDGRDAGSVVFEDAEYKFFLTALLAVCAQRWCNAQTAQGKKYTLQEARHYLQERDTRDQSRTLAPLVIPKDAHIIDTSALDVEEVVRKIYSIITL